MESSKKTIEYYQRLPYTLYREPVRDSDGTNYWTAEYLELRGCKTDGSTESEAIANLHELFDEYITIRIEENINIPEPSESPLFNSEIWIVLPQNQFSPSSPLNEMVEDTKETSGIYEEIAG
jgi:predicted RNase H-like HicB family nuclease